MACSKNPFGILANSEDDDVTIFTADRAKKSSADRAKKSSEHRSRRRTPAALRFLAAGPKPPSAEEASVGRCELDIGESEKLIEGGRSYGSGRPRKSYRSTRRTAVRLCAKQEVEDSISYKYRLFDRHSLCGRWKAVKREGFGRGNWGTIDDVGLEERPVWITNCSGTYEAIVMRADRSLNDATNIVDLTDDEDDNEDQVQEMTLDEYEKILEEKKKSLQALLLEFSAKEIDNDSFIKLDLENGSANEDDLSDKEFLEESEREESVDGFVIVGAAEEWNFVYGCGTGLVENPEHFADHDVI